MSDKQAQDTRNPSQMTGYERIKNTIQGKTVDYPASIFIATSAACRLAGVKQSEWSTQPEVLADTLIDFTKTCGCDGIYVTRDNLVVHEAMGGKVTFPDSGDALGSDPVLPILREFTKLTIPDPNQAAGMKTVIAAARRVVDKIDQECYVMANIDCGPFSTAANLRGVQNFMMDIMTEDPKLVQDYLEFCTDLVVAYGKAMQATGVHGIQYGDSSASLLSPALFERFALPYQASSIAQLQQDRCDFWLHICGKTDHLLPHLKALNMQVFEVDAMVPLAKAGQALTQCVIKGNLDTMALQESSAEEVYKATQMMINDSGIQDRLIVSAGCGVPQKTPLKNLQAMTRACREVKFD
jgi:uroporphyrinogen decarboxylase